MILKIQIELFNRFSVYISLKKIWITESRSIQTYKTATRFLGMQSVVTHFITSKRKLIFERKLTTQKYNNTFTYNLIIRSEAIFYYNLSSTLIFHEKRIL